MRQKKRKNNGKGDSASVRSRFASMSEGEMQLNFYRKTLVKPNNRQTGLSTFKGKLKLEPSTEKLK